MQGRADPGRRVTPTNPFEPFPAEAVEQSIAARFADVVRRHGARVAVRTRGESVTFDDLARLARRVANVLLDARGEGPEPVALLLGKGIPQLAGLLGTFLAGKIATPLDPATGPERLRAQLEGAGVGLILADATRVPLARAVSAAGGAALDVEALIARGSDRDPALRISPDAPAYILHTSGSTGRPKAVLHTQRTTLHQAHRATNRYHIAADDRVTWVAGLPTGQGMTNATMALLTGASLYPWSIREEGLHPLADWMTAERVTVARFSIGVLRYFLDELQGRDNLPAVRLVGVGSEAAYVRDAERFWERIVPTCLFANQISSTETGTIAAHIMDRDSARPDRMLPLGRPDDGVEIRLLDAAGRPVAAGEPGEIAVRSHFLAAGYWRDPELTRTTFTPDPDGTEARIYRMGDLGQYLPDGSLVHLGRRDFQVKIRGFRVEVEEIELTLREHPGVRAAAVVARPDARGEPALTGYVVATAPPGPGAAELRRYLGERLPSHMVPRAIVTLDALPTTVGGKIDRRALPEPDPLPARPAPIAPRSPVEERVAAIWAAVLGVEAVGVHDDFLELGGTSLLATRVVSRLLADLRIDVSAAALLAAPTVAEMAMVVTTELAGRLPATHGILPPSTG